MKRKHGDEEKLDVAVVSARIKRLKPSKRRQTACERFLSFAKACIIQPEKKKRLISERMRFINACTLALSDTFQGQSLPVQAIVLAYLDGVFGCRTELLDDCGYRRLLFVDDKTNSIVFSRRFDDAVLATASLAIQASDTEGYLLSVCQSHFASFDKAQYMGMFFSMSDWLDQQGTDRFLYQRTGAVGPQELGELGVVDFKGRGFTFPSTEHVKPKLREGEAILLGKNQVMFRNRFPGDWTLWDKEADIQIHVSFSHHAISSTVAYDESSGLIFCATLHHGVKYYWESERSQELHVSSHRFIVTESDARRENEMKKRIKWPTPTGTIDVFRFRLFPLSLNRLLLFTAQRYSSSAYVSVDMIMLDQQTLKEIDRKEVTFQYSASRLNWHVRVFQKDRILVFDRDTGKLWLFE
jgi:hypothetical protein